jgi:hypothetical protein
MKTSGVWILLGLLWLFPAPPLTAQQGKWGALFNGKDLNGWDTYLGPPLDDSGKMLSQQPVGLNHDPHQVFTVVDQQGEKLVRVSGENWGCMYTRYEYADFHLRLMFKWGKFLWGSKKNKKRDSGLLYFSVGENGADYGAWMRSQEFQIEEGNCGDYWGVAGGAEDIPATQSPNGDWVYNPSGSRYTFGEKRPVGRHCVKRGDAEKPSGEWNTLDLYCHGDTSVQMINGIVMMVLYHSSQLENGSLVPLTKGKLQIQSEGAEIFYKDIVIEPLIAIPAGWLN